MFGDDHLSWFDETVALGEERYHVGIKLYGDEHDGHSAQIGKQKTEHLPTVHLLA